MTFFIHTKHFLYLTKFLHININYFTVLKPLNPINELVNLEKKR